MTSFSSEEGRRKRGEEVAAGGVFPYERILLAFAGLSRADELLQLALHLTAGPGSELFLLRVLPGGRKRVDQESLYTELRTLNRRLHAEGIQARLEAVPAAGADALVAYAEACQVDMIIAIGRETNGGTYGRLVDELLRQAPCAAMALNAPPRQAAHEAGPHSARTANALPARDSDRTGVRAGN